MILLRPPLRDQRGSALLISLVLIVVITILGLALFELGQIEGQQAGASLGDARAFELAQAGMERAIRELSNRFLADDYGSESWADGANRPTCTPACETGVYRPMDLANNTLPVAGADPLTGQDPGGSFTVELKQVTVAEANNPISQGAGYTYPYGQTCIKSAPANPTVCANLMFVRSTGTVAGPPGFTATRTVQALVKAYSTSYFAGGLTAEKASGSCSDPAIDGRVLIAGSVHILGCTNSNPAFQIDGGVSMGVRNNWADLWPDTDLAGVPTLARLTPRQLVCPTGANCGGGLNLVESLEAELKVYGNTSNTMVRLNGNTDLGISTVTTASAYGDATVGSRYGKGRIDGVYVADGCPMPCTSQSFSFGGGSAIYVDTNNYTRPYPYRPPKLPLNNQLNTTVLYPRAADGTFINGTTYPNWWADYLVFHTNLNPGLSGGPAFAPTPAQLPPDGVDLNATGSYARISVDRANGGYCGHSSPHDYTTGQSLGNILNNGLDDGGGDGSQGFCHTFKFTDKAGAIRVGEICWRRFSGAGRTSLNSNNQPPNSGPPYPVTFHTLEFGSPSCDVPTTPSDPLIIEFLRRFRFSDSGAQSTYQYRGSALIYLGRNDLDVRQGLQTACTASPCTGQKFPDDNLLMFVLRDDGFVEIANSGDASNDRVRRFMAYVYAERSVKVRKATNLIGSLRAQQFCFNNSQATSGCGGVDGSDGSPSFFQASFIDLRRIPAELPASSGDSGNRWLVNIVPRFWMECRRGPGDTLPTTPTGTCQYQ